MTAVAMQIQGDYDNIVEYFSRLLLLQRRRVFPVHEYSFEYTKMSLIDDADRGILKESTDFPRKDIVDRVFCLHFNVHKGDERFTIDISRDMFEFLNVKDQNFNYDKFVSLIDDSTFRFF